MAVPKRKKSRSRTRSRRAQWKATVPALSTVEIAGRRVTVPGRLVRYFERYPDQLVNGQLEVPGGGHLKVPTLSLMFRCS